MAAPRSPRTALAGIVALALALALGAVLAASAGAASSQASGWRLPSSLSHCADPCPIGHRLLLARLSRDSAATGQASLSGRALMRARPAADTASGIIGFVTDAATKEPLTGIEVCVYDVVALEEQLYEKEEAEPACGTVVEAEGRYQIGVPPGKYVVEFFDPAHRYATQLFSDKTLAEEPTKVAVTAKVFTEGVNAAMVEGGRIQGAVTAAQDGAPLEGLLACALDFDDEGVGCAETGSGGKYQIGGLPTGTYKVIFLVPPLPGFNYLDAPLAGVKVTAGATTTGANAALPSGGEIQGTVTSASGGSPLAKVFVCAFAEIEEEEVEECARTQADGTYTIERLLTGSYGVEFFDPEFPPQFYPGKSKLSEAKAVPVTAGKPPVTGIDAVFGEETVHSGSIAGHVTSAATKSALAGAEVCAFAPPDEKVECVSSKADGSYALEDLPEGSYKVEFHDSPGYVTQFYSNKASLAEASTVVAAGAVKGIDAALAPVVAHETGGSVAGSVTSAASGDPLAGVEVCALPLSEGAEEECEFTEADGTYAIEGLPAGEYQVGFFAPGFQARFYDEKEFLSEAAVIHVTDGGRVPGIDARLVPFGSELPPTPGGGGTKPASPVSVKSSTGPPVATGGVLSTQIVVPLLSAGGRVRVSGRHASVKLDCVLGPCHGSLRLTITVLRRHRVHGHTVRRWAALVVGSGTFSLAQGASGTAKILLTAQGRRLLSSAAGHPRPGKLKLSAQGGSATLRSVLVS